MNNNKTGMEKSQEKCCAENENKVCKTAENFSYVLCEIRKHQKEKCLVPYIIGVIAVLLVAGRGFWGVYQYCFSDCIVRCCQKEQASESLKKQNLSDQKELGSDNGPNKINKNRGIVNANFKAEGYGSKIDFSLKGNTHLRSDCFWLIIFFFSVILLTMLLFLFFYISGEGRLLKNFLEHREIEKEIEIEKIKKGT